MSKRTFCLWGIGGLMALGHWLGVPPLVPAMNRLRMRSLNPTGTLRSASILIWSGIYGSEI
ncbi:MAG: hypothetical protein R3B91_08540 [Planctomycetaceae bacterium]